jgi:hypothetical protein
MTRAFVAWSAASPIRLALAGALLACWAVGAGPARADLVLSAPDLLVTPGSSGSFDLLLTNTPGAGSFDVAAFAVELSLVGGSGINFTVVTIATVVPYIFVDSGTTQPGADPLAPGLTPTHFIAIDSEFQLPGFRTLAPGDIYGVARVTYTVDAGAAPGVRTLGFGPATELTDDLLNLLPFTTLNGTITVGAVAAVPEPSTLAMAVFGVAALLARRRSCKLRLGIAICRGRGRPPTA